MQKKFFGIENKHLLSILLYLIIIIGGIACVFSFSIGINTYDLHDYIEGVFWADASLKSRSIINPDYVYYYIVPFGSNLIMSPFVYLLGTSYTANQLGMLVFFLLYLFTLYHLSTVLYDDLTDRLVFCSITSLFIFTYIGDNLLHHILCYGIGFICFLGELSCILSIRKQKHIKIFLSFLVFFCLWSSSNGISTAALSNLPVLFAMLFSAFKTKTIQKKGTLVLPAVVFLTTVFGLLVFHHYDSLATSLNQYDKRFILTGTDTIVNRLFIDLLSEYLRLFYFDPAEIPVFSPQGIFSIVKLVFAFGVIFFPVVLYKTQKGNQDTDKDDCYYLFISSCFLIIVVSLSQFLFFKTSVNRYLFNGVLSILLLFAFFFTRHLNETKHYYKLLPVILLTFLLLFKMIFHTLPYGNTKKEEIKQITHLLEEENLPIGYCFRRYYRSVELFTDKNIYNSKINFDLTSGRFYVNYDRIYKSDIYKPENIDKYYVILDPMDNVNKNGISLLEDMCRDRIEYGDVTVYIFSINDWDNMFIERQ